MEIVGPIITLIVIVLFIFYAGYSFREFIENRRRTKRTAYNIGNPGNMFVYIKTQPEELIGYDTLKTYQKPLWMAAWANFDDKGRIINAENK